MKPAVTAVCAALAILVVADTHAAPNPEAVGLSRERLERIDAMIERRIAAGDLAGAVTIVARRGEVAHVSVQGVMDLETRRPMRDDTLFRIASMTKPIVGVGVMMMVEENKLRLERPRVALHSGVPQSARRRRAARGRQRRGAELRHVPPQREVTIKDLLTHVSGFGSGPMSDGTIEPIARNEGETLADYIPRLGGTVLEFQPGSRWAYSPGAGFETLGRVLEIVSGLPLDEFFEQRIFAPLGMRAITFWPTEREWPRVATVYRREEQRPRQGRAAERHAVARRLFPRLGRPLQHGRELRAVRHHARERRRARRRPPPEPQVRRDARRRARSRHAAGPAARRRLRLERARRHRSRRARHAVVRRHLRLVRRARHALLRRPEGAARRRADDPDAERRRFAATSRTSSRKRSPTEPTMHLEANVSLSFNGDCEAARAGDDD